MSGQSRCHYLKSPAATSAEIVKSETEAKQMTMDAEHCLSERHLTRLAPLSAGMPVTNS